MRVAILRNGMVINVIECESLEMAQATLGGVAIDAEGLSIGVGFTQDGHGGFSPPMTSVFPPLKRWQFKAMVDFLGKAALIEAAIAQTEDHLQRSVVRARYLESDQYDRDDPLFSQLAPAVGLTSQQIDDAWLLIQAGSG